AIGDIRMIRSERLRPALERFAHQGLGFGVLPEPVERQCEAMEICKRMDVARPESCPPDRKGSPEKRLCLTVTMLRTIERTKIEQAAGDLKIIGLQLRFADRKRDEERRLGLREACLHPQRSSEMNQIVCQRDLVARSSLLLEGHGASEGSFGFGVAAQSL